MINHDELLFCDVECYWRNTFIVFKDINDKLLRIFHNNFTGLEDFIKGKTLVTYNGLFYDNAMIHGMLDLKTPEQLKHLNDRIIGGERIRIKNKRFKSLDCFQQIDVSMPSLKKIEGNMGKMILESSVPFTIERELNSDELMEAIEYCSYDVSMTIQVYKMREKGYFLPKLSLVEMVGNENAIDWNTTTLSANALLKKPLTKWSTIRVPDELLDLVPPEVIELWQTKEKGSITIKEFDNDIVFGFGGLHGANNKKKRFENVKLLDVASLYPNIIVNHNILGSATAAYKDILDERIRIKHIDKVKQEGLKLILNSVYGLLKSKYSLLFNPHASTTVCAIGQCILYDLSKRLAPTCEIVQINTDGVAFIPSNDVWKTIWKEWEQEHNLTLEEDDFKTFIQRDVNNYIGESPDGYLTTKGGDVNRFKEDAIFKNNNARIIDLAIVNKVLYGKDIIQTLSENLDNPVLYQYILRAGGTYEGTVDQNGVLQEKFNRVFAVKDGEFCLYKKRYDGGLVKFADAPDKMMLWNDDCSKLKGFENIIDLNHYYQIITKKLEKWL